MDIEMLRVYCLSLSGTTEDLKWGEHLCFMIEQKIYVITSLDSGMLTFKCDPEFFEELTVRHGIRQASHFAKRQWVSLESLDVMSGQELKEWISKSRLLVLSKLPKKMQKSYL